MSSLQHFIPLDICGENLSSLAMVKNVFCEVSLSPNGSLGKFTKGALEISRSQGWDGHEVTVALNFDL